MDRRRRSRSANKSFLGAAAIAVTALLWGCATPVNPAFPLTLREAERDLERMRCEPFRAERPVVVLAGWADPGIATWRLQERLRDHLGQDVQIVSVAFFSTFTFDACRERVIETLQERFPSASPDETVEVDVVAFSMGGLVARDAALPRAGQRRLNIARLFTIATPHEGAALADWPTIDPRVRSMRAESEFLRRLQDHGTPGYEMVSYARLGDFIVGPENTAPEGEHPYWVATPFPDLAHINAYNDERILADIVRRLRNEPPWTFRPARPVPGDSDGR